MVQSFRLICAIAGSENVKSFLSLSSMIPKFFTILVLFSAVSLPQSFSITGKVLDAETGEGLGYANIRAAGTTTGTSANRDGDYQLKLPAGNYKIAASYLGYFSDTITLGVRGNLTGIDFKLRQTNVTLPEITVLPGENPALVIIRKAIARKHYRDSLLTSYEFDAYTKGIIRTEKEISSRGNGGITLDIGSPDTAGLFITGILENESRGYFKKPDKYKEIILSRKQTSNFPSSINILTGGRLIQNFYDERINFLGTDLNGPVADDALDYYDYYILSASAIDKDTVFKISIAPLDKDDPGFTGSIYINNRAYDLAKIDLQLNRAANVGGIFDTISIFQQFDAFGGELYMPVDYRLFAKANVLNLARFGFELSSVLYDYKINPALGDDFFDKAVLTVVPDADKKDSLYWSGIQSIPGTEEELFAYRRIDSLSKIPFSFWDEFSILASQLKVAEGYYISAPLSLYHFNRVEGHTLDFGISGEDLLDYRLNSDFNISYGFSDKKVKTDLSAAYLLGEYRTTEINVNAYNSLKVLFGESEDYNDFLTTLLTLFSKYEFRDYYYSRGFDLNISGEVFPVLSLSSGYKNYLDRSAYNNSDFSFLNKEKLYRENPPIDEVNINQLNFGFTLDARNYIEDGYFRRRITEGKSYFILSGNIAHSNSPWLESTIKFTKYDMTLRGYLNSFRSTSLNFKIYGLYTVGGLPYQDLYSIPGNIDLLARDYTFRTLNVNEMVGDNTVTLNVENLLGDELFRMLNVPFLKSAELALKAFFNAAYIVNGSPSPSLPESQKQEFKTPFYEIGFGVGHVLLPMTIEFAWKLNHRGENNFRVGINSFAL